jgi:hypothetical protein
VKQHPERVHLGLQAPAIVKRGKYYLAGSDEEGHIGTRAAAPARRCRGPGGGGHGATRMREEVQAAQRSNGG